MKWSEISLEALMALSYPDKWQICCGDVRDEGGEADAALLLGSLTERAVERARAAAELYRAGRVRTIIPTGKPLWPYEGAELSEAEIMARVLREGGVPEKAIVMEEEALTTQENMLFGMVQILRTYDRIPNAVIIVTSVTHMKRSLALARALLPRGMKITGYPSFPDLPFDEWISLERNRRHVDDCVRIHKKLIDIGDVEDEEIRLPSGK